MTMQPPPPTVLVPDFCQETRAHILAPVEWVAPNDLITERDLRHSTGPTLCRLRRGLPGHLPEQTIEPRSDPRSIRNANPISIQEMISWLVSCSELMLPDIQQLRLRGALHELLLNAVEHGTLELGFQAKRKALAEGRYEELLLQRLTQPHLRNRQVAIQVRYEEDAKSLTYRIADEGSGFNWRRFLENSCGGGGSDDANGRGIFLARSLFPGLSYNDRGNEVTITVPLS